MPKDYLHPNVTIILQKIIFANPITKIVSTQKRQTHVLLSVQKVHSRANKKLLSTFCRKIHEAETTTERTATSSVITTT